MRDNVADTMAVLLNRKALADDIRMGVVCRLPAEIDHFAYKVVDSALPGQKVSYLPSNKQLQWNNGSTAFLFGSTQLDSMRGFQWAFSIGFDAHNWHTEGGDGYSAVETMQFNTRIGRDAECIILY